MELAQGSTCAYTRSPDQGDLKPREGETMAKAISCPKCGRKFSMAAHLARHMTTHSSKKKKAAKKIAKKTGKRRGRPKGSKNKKTLVAARSVAGVNLKGMELNELLALIESAKSEARKKLDDLQRALG